jgi:heat shock protein HslJ
MKSITFSIAVLIFAMFISQCSNYNQLTTQTEVLFRTDWKLTELQGEAVPDSVRSKFRFTPGKISGSTGCNYLSAGFTPGKNQTIRFSPEPVIEMECKDGNAAAMETKFLEALSKSTKWSMSGGGLSLGDGKTTFIRLGTL